MISFTISVNKKTYLEYFRIAAIWPALAMAVMFSSHSMAEMGQTAGASGAVASSSGNEQLRLSDCQFGFVTPGDAECGYLQVPENPQNPAGRHIALNVMRIPAVNRTADDPLFIIVGGPGGAAVRSAPQYLPYFRDLQQKRDIVFVDQRGTGHSNGLRCPLSEIELGQLSDQDRQERVSDMAERCVAELDTDLRFYTTPYAVEDLDAVRKALGYERINMWGVSYGTRVILAFMRNYPEQIRAAVLDGVAPVSIQLPRFVQEDGSSALGRIFRQCETDRVCADRFKGLREGWMNTLHELEREPRTISVRHPRSEEMIKTHLSANTLSSWIRLTLYSRELAPLIPLAVAQAINNDFSLLVSIALLATEEIEEHVSQGMQTTVLCAEDGYYRHSHASRSQLQSESQSQSQSSSPGRQEGTRPLLMLDSEQIFSRLCQHFPQGGIPDVYFTPVVSDVPALVLSGALDPVTPPRWGERVAEHLANSLHLIAPGAHHGVTMQGCAARVVTDFIEAGSLEALDAGCIDDIHPPAFFIDSAGPALQGSAAGVAQ